MSEYTAADQRADRAFLVGVNFGRDSERAQLDDALCDALMAARHGKYDGMTVEMHLEHLVERVRVRATPAKERS